MKTMKQCVSFEEAKKIYCNGFDVYLDGWRVPPAYLYSSHASDVELFYRSIDGKNRNGKWTAEVPANFRDALN